MRPLDALYGTRAWIGGRIRAGSGPDTWEPTPPGVHHRFLSVSWDAIDLQPDDGYGRNQGILYRAYRAWRRRALRYRQRLAMVGVVKREGAGDPPLGIPAAVAQRVLEVSSPDRRIARLLGWTLGVSDGRALKMLNHDDPRETVRWLLESAHRRIERMPRQAGLPIAGYIGEGVWECPLGHVSDQPTCRICRWRPIEPVPSRPAPRNRP